MLREDVRNLFASESLPNHGYTSFLEQGIIITKQTEFEDVDVNPGRSGFVFINAIPWITSFMHFLSPPVEDLKQNNLNTALYLYVEVIVVAITVWCKGVWNKVVVWKYYPD